MKQPLKVKDFLVSHTYFELHKSLKYKNMLYTHPAPQPSALPAFYESNAYISHATEAKGLLNTLYFWVKQINLRYKEQLFQLRPAPTVKILDYGCGVGDFVLYLNKLGYDAYGMEPNNKAFEIAYNKNPEKILNNTACLATHKYDIITLYHVLEHIPNLEEEIEKIAKALKPNGKLFVAVPNHLSYDARFYKSFWAAYDVPRHLWHFTDDAIENVFSQFGMIIESKHPLWFDAFYISLISEKYRKNILGFLTGPMIGLVSNLKAMFTGEFSSKIYKISKKNDF